MILGEKSKVHSPVSQEFIWVAEYYDGEHLAEFDFNTKESNSFYKINKTKVIRFGLVGSGSQAYFDVGNGVFTINNHRITVSYKTEDKEYPLTGRSLIYNDLITYKDAVSDTNIMARNKKDAFVNTIMQFNVGYKKQMELHNADINFQCVLGFPLNEDAYMEIKISSNKDLDGHLIFRRNGKIVDTIYSPLKANLTGCLDWTIK